MSKFREEIWKEICEEREHVKQEIIAKVLPVILEDLSEDVKTYILKNPCSGLLHHGIGTMIRNEYIHNNQLEDRFEIYTGGTLRCPDEISGILIKEVIKVLQVDSNDLSEETV